MMISQPALLCLNATWQRLTGQLSGEAESAIARIQPVAAEPPVALDGELAARSFAAAADDATSMPVAREQVRAATMDVDPNMPLTANETRARAAALRALALSRGRRFDAAGAAFTEAARLDPALDLTRTPAFWKLERAAHEAAIDAYQRSGRERDAAVLRARVQSTFRPKPLRPRQPVILSP